MAVRVTRGTSILSELRGRFRYPGSASFRQEGDEQQQQEQQQLEEEDAEAGEQHTMAALDSDSDATVNTDPLSELEEYFPAGEEDDDIEDKDEEEEVEGHDGGTTRKQGLYPSILIEDQQEKGETTTLSPSSILSLVEKRLHHNQASAALPRAATDAGEKREGKREKMQGGEETPKTTSMFAFYPLKTRTEGGNEGRKEGGREEGMEREKEVTKRFIRSLDIYGLCAEGRKGNGEMGEEGFDMSEEKQMCLLGSRGDNALLLAARLNDAEMVRRLLEEGRWKSDVRNAYGETLLHLAVSGGRGHVSLLPFLGILVGEGRRVGGTEGGNVGGWNVRTVLGRTPWMEAAVCGNIEGLKALWREGGREGGLEVGAVDNDGRNALHLAVMYRQEEAVYWLVERDGGREGDGWRKGVLLQGRDKDGMTPLHFAAMYNSVKLAQMLLNEGGSEGGRARTKEGETPMQVAERFGHVWTRRALEIMMEEAKDEERGVEGEEEEGAMESQTNSKARLHKWNGGKGEGREEVSGGMQVRIMVGGREVILEGMQIECVEIVGGWERGREGGGLAM
ncbi:ankyrin repeat protein [Nannochloropsis oceanica]